MWFSSLVTSWKSKHSRNRRSSSAGASSFRPRLEALEDRCVPATLNVTSNLDNGAPGTLRWAVGQANASNTADTIDILTTQTIVLTQGQLQLSQSMTIEATTGQATISGGGKSGVFYCYRSLGGGGNIYLTNLNITNGKATYGGGIYDYGAAFILDQCTLSGNSATYGGGIYLTGGAFPGNVNGHGYLSATSCTLSGNSATYGGGIDVGNGASTVYMVTKQVVKSSVTRGR